MSKTLKFFTKKWHPWNIIILVLSILLIGVLIWGGVTNWKFIPERVASVGPNKKLGSIEHPERKTFSRTAGSDSNSEHYHGEIQSPIVILGRGESLKRLPELKEQVDTVILVNCFWDCSHVSKAYYKDPLIHNFIKDKKIILFATPCEDFSNVQPFLKKYNVIAKFKTQFSKKIRIGKNELFKILPDEIIDPYIHLENNFKGGGTLATAVLYAFYTLKKNNIFIFGLDFYEKGYYLKNDNSDGADPYRSREERKKDWIKIFKFYGDIKFNIYTLANLNCNLNNVNIY